MIFIRDKVTLSQTFGDANPYDLPYVRAEVVNALRGKGTSNTKKNF
jgi:hypothetical protein